MIRHLLSLFIGAAIAALVLVAFVVPVVRETWRVQGFNEGNIAARWEMSERLHNEFPKIPSNCGEGRHLFEAKTNSVYVFDCPGGKQIHVQR